MGTKNFFATSVYKKISFIFIFAFLFSGCLQTTQSLNPFLLGGDRSHENSEQSGEYSYDKDLDVTSKAPDKPFRPKFFLVLGPGLARAFAHIGVLKEIAKNEIPVAGIVGMGWSGMVASEFTEQGSTHGLEWKASRSKDLKELASSSFWRSAPKERSPKEAQVMINKLLAHTNSTSTKTKLYIPLLSLRGKKLILADKTGLKHGVSVPPLFDSGERYAPYFFDLGSIVDKVKKLGAEKVIYIDVLNARTRFLPSASYGSAVRSYWNFTAQVSYQSQDKFDKVFMIKAETDLLDFKSILDLIRAGESIGQDLVEFLKEEYQY
jgi:NTE family protein